MKDPSSSKNNNNNVCEPLILPFLVVGALSGESESESWLDAEMDAVGMEAGCARAKAAKKKTNIL